MSSTPGQPQPNKSAHFCILAEALRRLANDAAWRSEVATKIVDKFAHSDIADTRRYAVCLEDAYARALAIKSGALA